MKKACQNHNYSEKQFREIPLWTPDLQWLALKFETQNFLGVYLADHHPNTDERNSNWIWNTNTSSKSGMYWIAVWHKTHRDKHAYQIMDSLALPLSSYKDILNTISGMQHKNISIENVLKNRMQSTNTFTCGWWSIYYLISSKFKTSVLPYLYSLNNSSINEHCLYNYFKTLFEGEWPKYILDNQHRNAMSSKWTGQQRCMHGKNCIEQYWKYSKP